VENEIEFRPTYKNRKHNNALFKLKSKLSMNSESMESIKDVSC